MNHSYKALIELIVDQEGVQRSVPVPAPVNGLTVYWEYAKMEATTEKVFWGKINRYFQKEDPSNPIMTRIIRPYFTDGILYTHKETGKRIIFFFYTPCALLLLLIMGIVYRMIRNFLCNRRQI